jgi:hypothetical protein
MYHEARTGGAEQHMSATLEDEVADLQRTNAELQRRLDKALAERDDKGSLRHLHAQILRGGAGPGIQFAAGAARGLRGLHH